MTKLMTYLPSRSLPVLMLLLSGCAGVGNYMQSTLSPSGNPNAPKTEALNMQRARGEAVAVQPITPMPGDVWPGPVPPVPTLDQIQKRMNTPLSQEYNQQYNASAGAAPSSSDRSSLLGPPGVTSRIINPAFVPPPVPASPPPFQVGQELMTPYGPAGVVTGSSNGRYQMVAPINGQGGGMLMPNGNGTATLIGPDGQQTTVLQPAR
jgi:hypothetical protein